MYVFPPHQVFGIHVYFIFPASQFRAAAFQVLNNHRWPVASVLDNTHLKSLFVKSAFLCFSWVTFLFCRLSLPTLACDCNPYGTSREQSGCSPVTGQCDCLPHVTGRDCGACEPGFYNLHSGQGCQR